MTAPALVLHLQLEAKPRAVPDAMFESESCELAEWLSSNRAAIIALLDAATAALANPCGDLRPTELLRTAA